VETPQIAHRVLIATDGSTGSAKAVEEGVRLAKLLDAEAIFVAVAPPPLLLPAGRGPRYGTSVDRSRTMRDALENAIPYAEERRVAFETILLDGSAEKETLELAREREVDLIVVGSRGRGPVKSALLGSVSTAIVHHADRPVLVVPSRDRVSERGLVGLDW